MTVSHKIDEELLIKMIRNKILYGQTKEQIVAAFPNVPQHEIFHAYVAAQILIKG